jgi:hypothetical protein
MMKTGLRIALAMIVLATLAAGMSGCASSGGSFVRQDVDFSYIRRVAIYPFRNLSQDVNASQKVSSIFLTQLLEQDALLVVERGDVLGTMARLQLGVESVLPAEKIVELGREMQVDALFFGTVEEYGLERSSRDYTNVVTASYSLYETQTGQMVWNAQVRTDGASFWRKLFGGGTASLYDVSSENVNRALESLF